MELLNTIPGEAKVYAGISNGDSSFNEWNEGEEMTIWVVRDLVNTIFLKEDLKIKNEIYVKQCKLHCFSFELIVK